jgi:hypothetical protein
MTSRDRGIWCPVRIRSWTPLSRADRNRIRRGEQPRVELMRSTWWSGSFDRWERKVVGAAEYDRRHAIIVAEVDRVIARVRGEAVVEVSL